MADVKPSPCCSRSLGTLYRLRKEHAGIDVGQARRLKDVENENARLKKLVEPRQSLRVPAPCRHALGPLASPQGNGRERRSG